LFQLIEDGLLTFDALLKSLRLVPLPDAWICRLTGNSAADWPHVELWDPI
jgi:hypothetical protein